LKKLKNFDKKKTGADTLHVTVKYLNIVSE